MTVGASVTEDEQREIYKALDAAGFPSASVGAREVLMAWATGKPMPDRRKNQRRKVS